MKRYDRSYFHRWYHDPRHRVRTTAELRREAALVVGVAEYVLGRPIGSVLDVGCGEGAWQPALARLRPRARYTGVEPSEWAVRRFGARRGIVRGTLARLDDAVPEEPWDLVICSDVLHYLDGPELRAGVAALAARVGGIAYLPVRTSADDFDGDRGGWRRRAPSYYLALLARAGLAPCGMQCYVPRARAAELAALERAR
ncbi:MAG TPA: class I SAM-dependent methyltransferase [Gemmatimonadaceae bacterium]|nr:class I SAM-dependent methyltransferase [Gemmatimonadaceae bacterium]